ncbi:hypothetical protein ILUMI_03440 [Ignelater luminosus]|uniref:Mutator-like transposase domain-containing protein n=1 Tax=Ignelater luminosus TaxID=2038154 RepID=A0A8K0DAT1_IGNLU|nr:hypothetical protein ILUMI_03440 [Ignelater luminosus]
MDDQKLESVDPIDNKSFITVVTDGTWSRRFNKSVFNSNSGVAYIVGHRTGKIFYIEEKNKYFCICATGEDTAPHNCYRIYTGSSTSTESFIILVEGFLSSVKMHNSNIWLRMKTAWVKKTVNHTKRGGYQLRCLATAITLNLKGKCCRSRKIQPRRYAETKTFAQPDEDYGANCETKEADLIELKVKKEKFLVELKKYLKTAEIIERGTIGQKMC